MKQTANNTIYQEPRRLLKVEEVAYRLGIAAKTTPEIEVISRKTNILKRSPVTTIPTAPAVAIITKVLYMF